MNPVLELLSQKASDFALNFEEVLRLYALERFLARLEKSESGALLIVRGSLITRFWAFPKHFRKVQDLDFVLPEPFQEEKGKKLIEKLLEIEDGDVLQFKSAYQAHKIWEDTPLPALRFEIPMEICTYPISIQVDLAFNDPIVPPAEFCPYTDILGESFQIRSVRPELAFAWKIHGLFEFWNQGNRWQVKTLYDLFLILDSHDLDCRILQEALRVAFEDRKTPFWVYQRVLNGQFGQSKGAQRGWEKWLEAHEGRIPFEDFRPLLGKIREITDPIFIELIGKNQ